MCRVGSDRDKAICHLQYFLYREYGEVRHLGIYVRDPNHEGLYSKYETIRGYDGRAQDGILVEKRAFARRLYLQTLSETNAIRLADAFAKEHGLTLEELRSIFGDKKLADPGYAGPKHRDIVKETISLRDAIQEQNWDVASAQVVKLRRMEHNNRRAVLDYADLKLETPCCILPAD